jgi:membrane protease YdiL (CAAX protease family)
MTEQAPTTAVVNLLRRSAGVRASAYFASMVGVLLTASRLPYDPKNPFTQAVQPKAFPGVVALTDLFTRLRPEDRATWTRQPTQDDLADLARGIALGLATSTATLGVGMAKGWISAPVWGWKDGLSPGTVLASAALTAAQQGIGVFNEEVIFRGYGLDTLCAAVGLPAAVTISTALFARAHGPGWKRFVGLGAAGLFLALLRLKTSSLWLAAGFHWGWNMAQISLLGPEDGPPSLRPLRLHGPTDWVGKPGEADPGWLQILSTMVLIVVAGGALRYQQAHRTMEKANTAGM